MATAHRFPAVGSAGRAAAALPRADVRTGVGGAAAVTRALRAMRELGDSKWEARGIQDARRQLAAVPFLGFSASGLPPSQTSGEGERASENKGRVDAQAAGVQGHPGGSQHVAAVISDDGQAGRGKPQAPAEVLDALRVGLDQVPLGDALPDGPSAKLQPARAGVLVAVLAALSVNLGKVCQKRGTQDLPLLLFKLSVCVIQRGPRAAHCSRALTLQNCFVIKCARFLRAGIHWAGAEKLCGQRLVAMWCLVGYRWGANDDGFALAGACIGCSTCARMRPRLCRHLFGLVCLLRLPVAMWC